VRFSDPGFLTVREFGTSSRFRFEQLDVQPRISGQPAVIQLPGNARLEVDDAEAFFLALQSNSAKRQWQYRLESRWPLIAATLLLTVAFGWFIYALGVPALAKQVAYRLPRDVDLALSTQGLQEMDRTVFLPSELKPERRQRIRAAMNEVTQVVGGGGFYSLQFRGGKNLGANAYAFPSGTIIFTDDLVRLAESTDELRVIMAHEVGHVRYRHTLRNLLQNSLLAGLVVVITGDIAAVGSLAAKIPKVLVEASYTREFEYAADAVAKEYLQATGKPRALFVGIMSRIAAQSTERPHELSLLKTHPAVEERIQAFLD
jgi:Zn-dependent protease with chaperone function